MDVVFKWSRMVAIILCASTLFVHPAAATSSFGHRSDADGCINPRGKAADELIQACLRALNSHMLNRVGVAAALTNLAAAYENKQDWNSAINALNAAIKLEGQTWPALVNRATAYSQIGKRDLALADLDEAVKLNSNQPIIFRARGELCLDQLKYDEAIVEFTKALSIDQKDAKALFYRSVAKRGKGDAHGAADDLQMAKQIDPQVENANAISVVKSGVPAL